jgi:phosphohistidine phosphatase
MKLYLMRHGPAEDQAESGIDADRVLSASGRERVRKVARLLVTAEEEPLLVVTSPLVRAVQTAEVVACETALGDRKGSVEARRSLAPGGDVAALVRTVAQAGGRRTMFVGHEPDLSAAAADLLGTFDRPFEKAMVVGARLAPTGGRASLRFVIDPKALCFDPDLRTSS